MIVKHIEAIPLVRELEEVFQGGTYKITSRNTIVTRVELDNGVVGETFGGDEDQYQLEVCRVVNTVYRPLLVGGDVRDVEVHWERMWTTQVDLNNRGIHSLDLAKHCVLTQAIAAVDIAMWDALGKSLQQPVYKLLGGFRDRIPVIAIGGYLREGDSFVDLETEIGRYKEEQIQGIKMKVGKLSVEEDIERAHLARRAGGPNFHLCSDSNQAWTVDEAMKFARGVYDLNFAWLEEPVRWHDQIEGNARVRMVGIPVNAGQGEISRHGCRELITRGAVDIINVDATIAAGVTEWRRIAGMAHSFGVTMAHHEEPQVALHLLAGVPHGLCVEIFPDYTRDPMWFDLPVEQPEIRDGYMLVSNRPGFGFNLRAETIEKWSAVDVN
ncbi:MAG: L-talarate/galactarate dehydratase [Candidatus Moanabacter tarae]|uniref:L-talarate/galactarate dehydratase n=1 Tax=Candidatus Moanibacter tarae TaxID=2200854 RepID=A0A2Z4ACQ7_9BACT|nr:MAG: L-talarate/galactarate dehydratase [Candidatus Moanabacter tarae]|tara:strand:+ start:25356 stop:26501 length:1146 start_codon:yes stop_codon:yes gene_type:complete